MKMENGSHFGRHLEFRRELQGDFWGLLVCCSTHIPGPILKNSACYEIFPGFDLYLPNALGLSSEVDFLMKINRFAFLRPPLGDLGATYDDHLRLTGKRVVDFLLALIELFSLGVTASGLPISVN